MDPEHPGVVRLKLEYMTGAGDCVLPRARDMAGEAAGTFVDTTGFQPLDPVSLLQGDVQLPAMPQVYVELQKTMADPASSAGDLARVVSKDPGLTAFLLRIVNSAFYGFASRIETVSRAIAVIGTRGLSALALGASIVEKFRATDGGAIDLDAYWRHCLACGVLARNLAQRLDLPDPERYFVAGLLHDIGRLAMFTIKPRRSQLLFAAAQGPPRLFNQVENDIFGFNHATFGSILLRKWNVPFDLVMKVLHHHDPHHSRNPRENGVVHLADVAAHALGWTHCADCAIQPLSTETWRLLELDPDIIGTIRDDAKSQINSLSRILLS
jgi:putative nucleotidyltransferase with HDIG domain